MSAAHQPLSSPTRPHMEVTLTQADITTMDFALAAIAASCAAATLADMSVDSSPSATTTRSSSPHRQQHSRQASRLAANAFFSNAPPGVSLVAYGRRLLKYNHCNPMGIMLGITLLARFCKATGHRPNNLSIHRLLLTSTVVALKAHNDVFYSNAYYAQVGGIPLAEMNKLEKAFLDGVHFSAMVNLREAYDITVSLANAGSGIPLDQHWNPIAPAKLSPEEGKMVQAAAVAAGNTLAHGADACTPFGDTRRSTDAHSSVLQAVTFVDDDLLCDAPGFGFFSSRHGRPASEALPTPATSVPPRCQSTASTTADEYGEVIGRSCVTSRRHSESTVSGL
jgi:hypothetical protein